MDQDDPEKRIAELERQLAEAHALRDQNAFAPSVGRPASTTGGFLTPEQVHNVAFAKPPRGKRGYNEDQVDAFLDVVEQQIGRRAGDAPSVAYPGQGGPPDLGAAANVGPPTEGRTAEHAPGHRPPPGAGYPQRWTMKVR